ncbi:MAG: hypothetical protein JSR46_11625, partial [Verrucomicrobia bacterium]|nr:hypothetical protein [Verrucomicrobiota bacterium]
FFWLFFREDPVWYATAIHMWDHRKLDPDINNFKANMLHYIQHTVEDQRVFLEAKTDRSLREECQLLVYDMMRLDPNLRLDSAAIVLRTTVLKEKLIFELECLKS